MLLGVIADDFTGAGDIANTLAKGLPGEGGLAVAQYMGIPDGPANPAVDHFVVAAAERPPSSRPSGRDGRTDQREIFY